MRANAEFEPFLRALGGRVRERREGLNLTLDDLAGRCGLSKAGIWQIEQGNSVPGAGTLWRLSRALKVTIDWIVKGDASDEA